MTITASTNGRDPQAAFAISPVAGGPLAATSISRASQAALTQALNTALGMAERAGLDASSATLLRTTPDEMLGFRSVLELALQHLTAGNAPAATALLQQVLGPAFALDQNQITLDTASNGARNAQIAYQAVAPSGAADPQVLTDPAKLRDWAAAAEQVAVAFDDLVTRLKERADLLSRSQ